MLSEASCSDALLVAPEDSSSSEEDHDSVADHDGWQILAAQEAADELRSDEVKGMPQVMQDFVLEASPPDVFEESDEQHSMSDDTITGNAVEASVAAQPPSDSESVEDPDAERAELIRQAREAALRLRHRGRSPHREAREQQPPQICRKRHSER